MPAFINIVHYPIFKSIQIMCLYMRLVHITVIRSVTAIIITLNCIFVVIKLAGIILVRVHSFINNDMLDDMGT